MDNLSKRIKITAGLGVLALLGIILSHLALTDIWHAGEPDLSAEWWVVRISAVVLIAFIAVVFSLLASLIKNTGKR